MSDASEIRHRTISTNGVELHVAEAGPDDGPLVVLCHGFPELWYSWRHQLPALADAGWHVVAPDQRGYGGSSRPAAIEDYDIVHLTDDLLGVLDELGQEQAVFVGHDWGAPVVWNLSLRAPDRVRAVVGMSVPFLPRGPMAPTELFKMVSGDNFFYILYFQEPGVADEELGRDPERTLRDFLWTISGDAPPGSWKLLPKDGGTMLGSLSEAPGLPGWLTADDLAYYADEFRRTGFTGGLNWYRNFDRNWQLSEGWGDRKVEQPALFIAGERDPVLTFTPAEVMDEWVSDLRGKVILPGAGHWVQQERPDDVNRTLRAFLEGLSLSGLDA